MMNREFIDRLNRENANRGLNTFHAKLDRTIHDMGTLEDSMKRFRSGDVARIYHDTSYSIDRSGGIMRETRKYKEHVEPPFSWLRSKISSFINRFKTEWEDVDDE